MGFDRTELVSRALQTVRDSQLLLQRACLAVARRQLVQSETAALLADLAAAPYADIRDHVERGVRMRQRPAPRTLAIVGGHRRDESEVMDVALVRRYSRVLKIAGGVLVVAAGAVEQPHLAVVLDDLVAPGPLAAAVLLQELAPTTDILVVADDGDVRSTAEALGYASCPSTVRADELEGLLDGLAA